jgi:pseudouridine-5'-phosphate glycosidase
MKLKDVLVVAPEVEEALADRRPVVALESTIVTHGMPYPDNLETARRVEATVRAAGAVPATIAVLDGKVRVGLGEATLSRLAREKDVLKLSRADLAYAVSSKRVGSTTVAATMIAASLAGIRVFATGGIGGVHRGAETSFDISADLDELAHTDVIVVSAGAKAILDIGKTLEVLETKGVPVIGFGTPTFPAFWSRDSGFAAPIRMDTPAEIAQFVVARRALGISGGMLIGNPVPREMEISLSRLEKYIAVAIAEAERAGIRGKAVTPYLLQRIFEMSAGRSLETNVALIVDNARVASLIAAAVARV